MLNLRPAALAAAVLATALGLGATPSPAQQKITIGVSLAQDDNPFYIAMLHGHPRSRPGARLGRRDRFGQRG